MEIFSCKYFSYSVINGGLGLNWFLTKMNICHSCIKYEFEKFFIFPENDLFHEEIQREV